MTVQSYVFLLTNWDCGGNKCSHFNILSLGLAFFLCSISIVNISCSPNLDDGIHLHLIGRDVAADGMTNIRDRLHHKSPDLDVVLCVCVYSVYSCAWRREKEG